jgi:hypothetical protein
MELVSDVGRVESCFSPFGDSVGVGATHPMLLLGDEGLVELCSVRLEVVLILSQDRCMVCME